MNLFEEIAKAQRSNMELSDDTKKATHGSNVGLYIVKLEGGVWLAPWDGDPGRTLVRRWAERFDTLDTAATALLKARESRNFVNAEIEMYSINITGG